MEGRPSGLSPREDADDRVQRTEDDVFEEYVERINGGERLDRDHLRRRYPEYAERLIAELELYEGMDWEPRSHDLLGTLGDYTLRRQIGRGGMGVVYEAWQNSLDRQVALKVLPAGIAADDTAFHRFMREAKTAAKLSHPHVVGIYGMGVEQNTPYYAMEFVEGKTLAQVLTRVKDAEPETDTPFGKKDCAGYFENLARTFADVADGLQHAHSRAIIHRDIKPSNLILDGQGRLRILDFGLARLEGQESLTISGDVVGTPQYMSPEQARRKKIPVDHRTDVYSLGATLYEVLALLPPFQGKDHADTLSQIIDRDPVAPRKVNPNLPKDLETIALKCLRKEAADRYGTAEALAQDLRRFARGDRIEARPMGPWEALFRRAARRKGVLAAGLLLIILLAANGWLALKAHREAALRLEESYEPRVRRAVELLQLDALNRRAEAWEPLIIDKTGILFRPGFPRDAFARGDPGPVETAVGELEAAEKSVPRRPDAPFYLAKALLLLERVDEALDALARAIEVDPRFVPALVLRADVLDRRGEREAAKAAAREAERGARGTWGEPWLAARRLERRRAWKEARAALDLLIELEAAGRSSYVGAGIEARIGRAVARLEERDLAGALQDISVARFLWPEAVEPSLLEAKGYYLLGDKPKAAELLDALHRGARFQDDVAVGVMAIYVGLRDYEEALAWAGKLSAGYLKEMMLAEALILLGRLDEAEGALRAALGHRPSDVHSSVVLASVLSVGAGQFERALEVLKASIDGNPRNADLHCHLAKLYWDWRKPELAIEYQRRALDLSPNRTGASSDLGLYLIEVGEAAEGVQRLREGCDMDHQDLLAWNNLGYGLARMAKIEEAVEAFGKAIGVDPGHSWPRWNRGQALERLGRLEEALAEHRQALRLLPLSQAGYADAGRILERQGKQHEAVAAYVDAVEVEPWDGAAHGALASILRASGFEPAGSELDRLAACLEKAYPGGAKDARVLGTLSLTLVLAPGRRHLDRALELVLRGVEAARESPADVKADLLATLKFVLRRVQAQRSPEGHPLALLPSLPDYAALDDLLGDWDQAMSGRAWRHVEPLRAREPLGDDMNRLLYLEARLLEAAGSLHEAAERYARLSAEDASQPEPWLRLAGCLRAAGDPAAAVATIERALPAVPAGDRSLRDLHLVISFADLGRSPGEILPCGAHEAAGEAADWRWLLERLATQEPIRIDCGGRGFTSKAGHVWAADRFFTGGHDGGCLSIEVEGSEDDPLYRTERWFPGPPSLAGYRLPLPPATYRVTLHFAETWFKGKAMRRFDVLIEGRIALEDHEPLAAGACAAHTVRHDVSVSDGMLDMVFLRKVDNPMVAGIEVERIGP